MPAPPAGRPVEVSHEEEGRAGAPLWIVPPDPHIPAADSHPDPAGGDERKRTPANTVPSHPVPSHPVPSIERALSGPAKDRIDGWRRRVKVVPGGQGPGKPDQETLDRDRARLPLAGPCRLVFLGCTSGAGQTVTALTTGQMLAGLRGETIAAIDLNPGEGSLSRQARVAPVLTVSALLAGSPPSDAVKTGARLDVIASDADPASSPALGERDYARLAELTARHYPVAVVDPGASEVTRVLGIADQLVLVAPASGDAPRSLAMTQEWLGAHGHGDLAARAVTVINGVSKSSMGDVEQAEAVARGRCRAIVRIPWDDVLETGPAGTSSLRPQARHAYTALAGVLIAGLAAAPVPRKVLH
jgi:MinD-like ATPase involved in chromosome partitioning or flagellar assembly